MCGRCENRHWRLLGAEGAAFTENVWFEEAQGGPTRCNCKVVYAAIKNSCVPTLKFSDSIMLKRSSLRPIVLSTS